jgi:hypothetical protein
MIPHMKWDAPTITAIASFISSLSAIGAIISSWLNGRKIQEVHVGINSRLTELLRLKGIASHAEGKQEGIAESKK